MSGQYNALFFWGQCFGGAGHGGFFHENGVGFVDKEMRLWWTRFVSSTGGFGCVRSLPRTAA